MKFSKRLGLNEPDKLQDILILAVDVRSDHVPTMLVILLCGEAICGHRCADITHQVFKSTVSKLPQDYIGHFKVTKLGFCELFLPADAPKLGHLVSEATFYRSGWV